jgi:hypothetical protein
MSTQPQGPAGNPPPGTPANWIHPSGWWWSGEMWHPPLAQQPSPPQVAGPHPTQWWHDGHKWRPPVGAQPTRMQLIGQLPGMLLKLTFLVIFFVIIVVFLVNL